MRDHRDHQHCRKLLHDRRVELGMTQTELAALVDVTQGRISDWESGRIGIGSDHRRGLGRALGVVFPRRKDHR